MFLASTSASDVREEATATHPSGDAKADSADPSTESNEMVDVGNTGAEIRIIVVRKTNTQMILAPCSLNFHSAL
jgi:hypothetical protein